MHSQRGIYGDRGVFHCCNHYKVFKHNRVTDSLIFIQQQDIRSHPPCKFFRLCNCMAIHLMVLASPPESQCLALAACTAIFPFISMQSVSPFHNSVNQLSLLIPPTSAAVHESRALCSPAWLASCGKGTRKPPEFCTSIFLASM